jgi:uncharacterized damage-inducible protein DinB
MEKLVAVLDYGPKDLAESFRAARRDTVIIAEEVGEEHYGFSPASGSRTVAQCLIHMAMAPKIQQQFHSINRFDKAQGAVLIRFAATVSAEEHAPRSKAQIVGLLRDGGEEFARWLEDLPPDFLDERVAVEPGRTKTRFEVILRVKEHEIHHRGQLMLIERMIGIVPHTTRDKGRMAPAQSEHDRVKG